MSTTIYLAWSGAYSDRGVIGAFTDRSMAEAIAKSVDPEDGRVSELLVDDPKLVPVATEAAKHVPPMPLWRCESDTRSIEVSYARTNAGIYSDEPPVGTVSPAGMTRGAHLLVTVFARDEDHATKIAADKFREFAALTGWPGKVGSRFGVTPSGRNTTAPDTTIMRALEKMGVTGRPCPNCGRLYHGAGGCVDA